MVELLHPVAEVLHALLSCLKIDLPVVIGSCSREVSGAGTRSKLWDMLRRPIRARLVISPACGSTMVFHMAKCLGFGGRPRRLAQSVTMLGRSEEVIVFLGIMGVLIIFL